MGGRDVSTRVPMCSDAGFARHAALERLLRGQFRRRRRRPVRSASACDTCQRSGFKVFAHLVTSFITGTQSSRGHLDVRKQNKTLIPIEANLIECTSTRLCDALSQVSQCRRHGGDSRHVFNEPCRVIDIRRTARGIALKCPACKPISP